MASTLLPPGMKTNCFHFTSGFSINKTQLYTKQARKNKGSTNGALKGFCKVESTSLAVKGKATGNKMSADSHLSFALPSHVPPQPQSRGGTESAKLTQAPCLIRSGSWDHTFPQVLLSLYHFLC